MIEIIPKPVQKLPLWHNFLFYFSILLFLVSLTGYFLLKHFSEEISQEIKDLEEILTEEKTLSEVVLETKVLNYQKKIGNFSQLIKKHKRISKIFEFFESICHPKVWFSRFNLSREPFQLRVSGETENFHFLEQQILIFKKEPLIEEVNLSNISFGEKGKVNFSLSLTLNPALFQ